jgi:hypothetical protein
MKLQGSEVQDHETLQSQIGKIAENRLPLSGLEIFHGRLSTKRRHWNSYSITSSGALPTAMFQAAVTHHCAK